MTEFIENQFKFKWIESGKYLHQYSDGTLINEPPCFIVEKPTFKVVPQLTFGFPLEHFPNFLLYMSQNHPKLTKCINRLKSIKEFPKFFINRKFDKGESLALFFKVYADLAQNEIVTKELGPKAVFTLMSRCSFSEQFLQLENQEQESFKKNCFSYLKVNGDKQLFKKPYGLFLGEDLLNPEAIEIQEIVTPLIKIVNGITVEKWFSSIVDPKIFVKEKEENLFSLQKVLTKLLNKKYEECVEQSLIKVVLENIKNDEFKINYTDLLSPPPFLKNSYSMRKYSAKKGLCLIEMRGYALKFSGVDFRLTDSLLLKNWLVKEVFNFQKNWNPLIAIKEHLLSQIELYFSILNNDSTNNEEKIDILKNGKEIKLKEKTTLYYSTYFAPIENALEENNIDNSI